MAARAAGGMEAGGIAAAGIAAKTAVGEEMEEATEEADEEDVLVLVSEGAHSGRCEMVSEVRATAQGRAQGWAQGCRQAATTGGAAANAPSWGSWKRFPRLYEVHAAGRNWALERRGCGGECGLGEPAAWLGMLGAVSGRV